MKFINNSKAEVVRKRSMKLDVHPAVFSDEEDDQEDQEEEEGLKTTSPSSRQDSGEICSSHNKTLEKRDSFSKLLNSFGRIL